MHHQRGNATNAQERCNFRWKFANAYVRGETALYAESTGMLAVCACEG